MYNISSSTVYFSFLFYCSQSCTLFRQSHLQPLTWSPNCTPICGSVWGQTGQNIKGKVWKLHLTSRLLPHYSDLGGKKWLVSSDTLDPTFKVMDFLTQALHQRALHYVLFWPICTAFRFDTWRDAAYYAAADECLLDTCNRVSVWLRVAGWQGDWSNICKLLHY